MPVRTMAEVIVALVAVGVQAPDEAEVDDLRDVGLAAALGEDDVGRLDVAVEEPALVRFPERSRHLRQDADDPPGRLCAVAPHQLFEVDAVEILHRVIEDAVRRAPVVVDRDRVRMSELRGELHFALEAAQVRLRPRDPAGAA